MSKTIKDSMGDEHTLPEFHGNPNDLEWNPEFVFNLKERLEQADEYAESVNRLLDEKDKAISELVDALDSVLMLFEKNQAIDLDVLEELVNKHKTPEYMKASQEIAGDDYVKGE